MLYILNILDRDQRFSMLDQQQQAFLKERMMRSRRTVFANAMAKAKGIHIPPNAEYEDIEHLLDDWIYVGYIDAGHVTPELKCECGRALRYQHHVKHKITGDVMKFGIDHLKEHLNIDASIVSIIRKGLDAVDFELDEVLIKIQDHWTPEPEILNHPNLTNEAKEMISLHLPILDRHIRRLTVYRKLHAAHIIQASVSKDRAEHEVNAVEYDLFTVEQEYTLEQSLREPEKDSLDARFQDPVRQYLQRGIRSARTICELLIREHAAPDGRFLTEKPKIYYPVCLFIEEAHPGIEVTDLGRVDRHYTIASV